MIFRDESETPRISMNWRQKFFIVVLDLAILVELCIAMASASANPETFTPSFMKPFFLMFIPTMVIGFVGFRKLRDRVQQSAG